MMNSVMYTHRQIVLKRPNQRGTERQVELMRDNTVVQSEI
jgi:hypothetical protein